MNYRIKELCKEKGITLGELSDKVGIARESISRIIGGNNTSTDTLQRIADILNVPFTDLFERPKSNTITCPKCGTLLEVKEPVDTTGKNGIPKIPLDTKNTTGKNGIPVKPAASPITGTPEPEPQKRTFFPATNYNTRPLFKVREGTLIHFDNKQYTQGNITDAIALEMLRDNPARIKYFEIYPDDWEELIKKL